MECHRICILLLFSTLLVGITGKGTTCSLVKLRTCGQDETCEQVAEGDTGICKCRPGYRRASSGGCDPLPTSETPVDLPPDKKSESNLGPAPPQASSEQIGGTGASSVSGLSIALGTLIPLALIGVAVAVVYSARRYRWHERLRRIGIRRYEEVFIGRTEEEDDDAPIA